jgi:transposase InsO family protein
MQWRPWSVSCGGRIRGGVRGGCGTSWGCGGWWALPSRSTVYRVLVRAHLVEGRPRRSRASYRRWERPAPMDLWQLDATASVWLVDGTELKVITGEDDHSRFSLFATVVRRATGRAVCRTFAAALAAYGCPDQVLTDIQTG